MFRITILFSTLRECGPLAIILPELDALFGMPQPPHYHPVIDCGVHAMLDLDDDALGVRFAALTHDLGKSNTPQDILPYHVRQEKRGVDLLQPLCECLRVSGECHELALLAARYNDNVYRACELRPETIAPLLHHYDA